MVVRPPQRRHHPASRSTAGRAERGAAAYFADVFTVAPVGGGASFSQKNLFSDSLSAANLAADREAGGLPDARRRPRADAELGARLFAVSPIFPTAVNLTKRQAEIYDGSGLQLGGFTDLIPVRVPGGVTTSTTAWGLIWSRMRTLEGPNGAQQTKVLPDHAGHPRGLLHLGRQPDHNPVVNVLGYGSYSFHYLIDGDQDFPAPSPDQQARALPGESRSCRPPRTTSASTGTS